jgi:hypothetical protein
LDKLETKVAQGTEAAQLLGNEILARAFDETRQGIMEAWALSDPKSPDDQRHWLSMVKCLDQVRRAIYKHVETGKLAENEIKRASKGNLLRDIMGAKQ